MIIAEVAMMPLEASGKRCGTPLTAATPFNAAPPSPPLGYSAATAWGLQASPLPAAFMSRVFTTSAGVATLAGQLNGGEEPRSKVRASQGATRLEKQEILTLQVA